MTLEDFFTLTEMKDGLSTPSRVEDLISMMQKEKDSVVKNVSEAARQWCTVASTLAATESKDSLDHFIRLNGLYFLDWWLQEAKKCTDDANDSSLEELINTLLGALKKLPIDKEMSVSSGIGISVENLFAHKSFRVQETARALFDSWNQGRENELDNLDAEKDGGHLHSEVKPGDASVTTVGTITTAGSGCLENSATDISPVGASGGEDNHVVNLDGMQPESTKGVEIPNDQNASSTDLTRLDEDRFQGDAQDASSTPACCQESVATAEESSLNGVGRARIDETCRSPLVGKVKASSPEVPNSVTMSDKARFSPDKLGKKEISPFCTKIGPEDESAVDPLNPQLSVLEPLVVNDVDSKESESRPKRKPLTGFDGDASTLISKPKSEGTDASELDNSSGKLELRILDQDGALHSNVSQDLSINGCILRNSEEPETAIHKEEVGALKDMKELDVESNLRVGKSAIASCISKPNDTKTSDRVGKKRLEMELDFVVDDALEVARLVAKEVEREVVDYREPLCSTSSDKNSEAKVMHPKSPDSVNGEQDFATVGPENEMLIDHNLPGEAPSPEGYDYSRDSKSMERAEDFVGDQDSSQVTEAAQAPAQSIEKNLCDFDLNEEVHSDEMDHPKIPISPPITVSASKPALHQLPLPRHFGGEQGWKGSAATSAFRPASPRRIPDEKALSVERSHSSKQRQNFLDIDLNVAGANNDGTNDPVLVKQIPVSSGLPSGESSVEVNSRRAERLKLDLNRVSEDEDAPLSDCRMGGQASYRTRNGHHSPSPASSSSSRQPSMLNIDLNDNPCVVDSHIQQRDLGYSSFHACGGLKRDDPVISIMGARVAINKKEIGPQTVPFFPNAQVTEFPTGVNIARSGGAVGPHSAMAYAPVPGFMYNGLSIGATTAISPFMYGATTASDPFRVDSRVPVVPHVMSSPLAIPPPYSQSPFFVGMTSMPSGFNGVGSRQPPNLDLNSGWAEFGDNEHERRILRQSFIQAPAMLDEEMRSAASQPSSSGIRVKRKEPDSGWDSYPVIYKQQQAPWQ